MTLLIFFFFNDTATTEIYTLSLHDALPICAASGRRGQYPDNGGTNRVPRSERHSAHPERGRLKPAAADRKSTRLNSSHSQISYAVFCLKKKKDSDELAVGRGI